MAPGALAAQRIRRRSSTHTQELWWFALTLAVVAPVLCYSFAAALGAAALLLLLRPWPRLRQPLLPEPRPEGRAELSWAEATADCPRTGEQYLVLGVGFLGRRIVDRLLERGEKRVRLFDIARCAAYDGDPRVQSVTGDVTNYADVLRACEGVDCVFSTFACIQFFARLPQQAGVSQRVNIGGTENVLRACREAGVRRLVYTSTSNVMVTPGMERFGMDERAPLVPRSRSHNHYTWTKAVAEELVLRREEGSALRISVVRPSSVVFGPGDVRIVERALTPAAGGAYFAPLMFCNAVCDYVYVDNVVLGELKAEARLREGAPGVDGEVFNISNDEPYTFEEFWLVVQRHVPGLYVFSLPEPLIRGLAFLSERLQATQAGSKVVTKLLGEQFRNLTPATITTTSMSYTVDCSKAHERLNWRPLWDVEQGVQLTVDAILARSSQRRGASLTRA